MERLVVELSDIRAFNFDSMLGDCFGEKVNYWASPYVQNYLFLPEELPIELYGLHVFIWAYGAFCGEFSANTPYFYDSKNIKYAISFLDYIGDKELKSLLINSENKISKLNPDSVKSNDIGEYNTKEASLIQDIIWDSEIQSYIENDSRKMHSLENQSLSFLHEIKKKFSRDDDWIQKTKKR